MSDTNQGLDSDSPTEIQQSTSNAELATPYTGLVGTAILWHWDIRKDQFNMDFSALNAMLRLTIKVNNIEDFLNLLSKQDRRKIVVMFKHIMADKTVPPIKICLAPKDSTTSYCLVKAHKGENNTLQGELRPLVTMPSNGEFANMFQQIFENNHHGMILTDEKSNIIVCNNYVERWSGYALEELIGQNMRLFNASKHGKDYYVDMWQKIEQEGFWIGHILSRRKDGSAIPQELTIQKIVSTTNNVYYLGISQDLSKSLYRVDGKEYGGVELLTQLPNKEDFKLRLAGVHQQMNAADGLLLLAFTPKLTEGRELDQKQELANSLSYFTDNAITGYLGGDTFTVAMRYQRRDDQPHSLSIYSAIKRLFAYLRKSLEPAVYQLVVESTVGASVLNMDADVPNKLIPHALQAMFERHNENGHNVCFYSSKLHAKLEQRGRMEAIVTQAIEEETVEVFFQPIVETTDWQVCKFETLCRFRDENGDLLNTQEMVLIAEDLNLVSQLDLIVAEKAMQCRELLALSFNDEIKIAINVSLNSIKPLKAVLDDVNSLLQRYPEHAPYLTIELTESAYFEREDNDSQALTNIRSMGVMIAIDDFGSGYSSFSYLKDGHFDFLKIDIEFITGITYGSHNFHIVKMIVKLAHT
jgi:PAS domain S-box-containing protein